ncbi:MobF family relaxase [Glycomyces sp. NRRL B-16210]|uniref:MobF family relaxase n=1 Tax=Glycomyces sp. NRRL B-16210 TaxID=1463821 RepID=UPI001061577D|nr:MobF family relaxase [Glycomyces sp. NRRL B-16210]
MTVHKLTVGDGYTYLTRQTAGGDVPRAPGQSAAGYYTQAGNPPGRWTGSGIEALGLEPGQQVVEAQMRNLFGEGLHPDAEAIQDAYLAEHLRPGLTAAQEHRVQAAAERAGKLGQRFPAYKILEPFQQRVAERLRDVAAETGRAPTPAEVAKVKREEATRQRAGVAGYDLVFTPVKSVSVLWALHPDEAVRSEVKAAHDAAVKQAVAMLEEHAAFTRSGAGGAAQIETNGLVATAFDHHDSRSGDPDLHTHLAVANKIQGRDGKWRSLDGTALYAVGVAASETYNAAIEAELTARLGVSFVDRPGPARSNRPVREIEGIDPAMLKHFSARRTAIEARYSILRSEFRARHGRDPDPQAAYELAQQATLETREGKAAPRSLDQMRTEWTAQAFAQFGPDAVRDIQAAVPGVQQPQARTRLEPEEVERLAQAVIARVGEERATWGRWNLHAEAARVIRGIDAVLGPEDQREAVDRIVAAATGEGHSIQLGQNAPVSEPVLLQRSDGTSVFKRHESDRFTSQAVLDAEQRLVKAAQTPTVWSASANVVAERITGFEARHGRTLDAGQRALVTAFTTDDRLLAVGIGPAGSGKTTAMRAFKEALATEGRRLIGLAPSAQAANVLAADLGITCSTVDKFLWQVNPGNLLNGPELVEAIRSIETAQADRKAEGDVDGLMAPVGDLRPGDVLLVDEASMAGTFNLDRITALAQHAGAQVRLLGDDCQLGAVASGGVLRLIAAEAGATELRDLHRFTDPAFATASLRLREGDTAGLDYFQDRERLRGGSRDAMLQAAYAGWKADTAAGRTSLMMAYANTDVTTLSTWARDDRIAAGQVAETGVLLGNGQVAGRGDWVVTRHNQYGLKYCGGKDFVRNGATWDVIDTRADGSLKVKSRESGGTLVLPSEYVAEHVELAYAATVHRCQGMTVDTAHPVLTDQMTRDALYVAATRAAETTTLYAVTHTEIPADTDHQFDRPKWDPDATAAREIAEQILAREPDNLSATETGQRLTARSGDLHELVARYRTATDMAADHHYNDLITRVLTPVFTAEYLADIEANGRGALAGTLAKAETKGWNPEQILTLAIARGPVDDAGSVAAVLIGRINGHMEDHTPPPAGAQPTPEDLDRYRELLRTHYPDAHLKDESAIHPRPVGFPANAAHEAEPTRAANRYRAELVEVLGVELADQVTAERAWPAVIGSLRRAEEAGQYSTEALQRAAAQRDFDGLDTISPNLAWRIERQTRLIELDPTHTGQAWPALAWTVKAWENAGGDATELIDDLAPDRTLTGLALEAGHELTWHQLLETIEHAPHPLPWATAHAALHHSDAVPAELRDYLDHVAGAITTRVDLLTDHAITERPAWTEAFGETPTDEGTLERWHTAIALAAAHRDQMRTETDDSAHPFGPYPEEGRAGHHSWWAAASAALTIDQPNEPITNTGLAESAAHQLTIAVAQAVYTALPAADRAAVHDLIASTRGPSWHMIAHAPSDAVTQSPLARDLVDALSMQGLLTPELAGELRMTARHVRDGNSPEPIENGVIDQPLESAFDSQSDCEQTRTHRI